MAHLGVEAIGMVAAVLTTASFLPQALHILRTRNAAGISLVMYSMFTAGVAFWLVYGIIVGAPSIIAANAVTLTLAGCILITTFWHRRRPDVDDVEEGME